MARSIRPLGLDAEVIAALKRLAALEHPESDIRDYSVQRDGGPTRITLTWFADDEFSVPSDIEVTGLDKEQPEYVTGQASLFEQHANAKIREMRGE